MDKGKIAISRGSTSIILPVLPESFEITDTWQNEEVNINKIGLITLIGKRGLKTITLNSFFPKQDYEFTTQYGITGNPWDIIRVLLAWRGKKLTFSISGTKDIVSWPCVIDGDLTYGEKDASGDVYYTITLKEFKKTNTKRTVQGKSITFPYTTKKGDTLMSIAKKCGGGKVQAQKLYAQNNTACKRGFKKWLKKLSTDAKKKAYKKKAAINKELPKGVKIYSVGGRTSAVSFGMS